MAGNIEDILLTVVLRESHACIHRSARLPDGFRQPVRGGIDFALRCMQAQTGVFHLVADGDLVTDLYELGQMAVQLLCRERDGHRLRFHGVTVGPDE